MPRRKSNAQLEATNNEHTATTTTDAQRLHFSLRVLWLPSDVNAGAGVGEGVRNVMKSVAGELSGLTLVGAGAGVTEEEGGGVTVSLKFDTAT